MAVATPNMGLHEWTATDDNFSFQDLHDNWKAIDAHDHSPGKGIQLGTTAFPNDAFVPAKFGTRAITPDRFATSPQASSAFSADKFTNANHSVVRYKMQLFGRVDPTAIPNAGTYFVRSDNQGPGGASTGKPAIFQVNASDWAVPNKTTQIVFRVQYITNGTAFGSNLTWGILPVTSFSGGAGSITVSVGAMAASPQWLVAPGTSQIAGLTSLTTGVSVGPLPADGPYVPGVVATAAAAANSVILFRAQIGIRWS